MKNELIEEFEEGWKHFCNCIDFASSNLDAEAIKFMNEMPSRVIMALKEKAKNNDEKIEEKSIEEKGDQKNQKAG